MVAFTLSFNTYLKDDPMNLHGSNIPAGLALAKDTLLNANDRVPNNRKHMILVNDGATYLLCNKSTSTRSGYDSNTTLTRVADTTGTIVGYSQDGN